MNKTVLVLSALAEVMILSWLPIWLAVIPVLTIAYVLRLKYMKPAEIFVWGIGLGWFVDVLLAFANNEYLLSWIILATIAALNSRGDKENRYSLFEIIGLVLTQVLSLHILSIMLEENLNFNISEVVVVFYALILGLLSTSLIYLFIHSLSKPTKGSL